MLRVWDVEQAASVAVLEVHTDSVNCVCRVTVGARAGGGGAGGTLQRVVSGSDDQTLRVWDVERRQTVAVVEGHRDAVTCVCVVAMSAGAGGDGAEWTVQRVVSGSADHTLRMWNATPGRWGAPVSRVDLPGAPSQMVPVTGHPSLLLVVCDGRVAVLPDLAGGPPRPLAAPAGPTCALMPAPSRLVLGSRSGRLHLASLLL